MGGGDIPQQGVEALAQLAERALRNFLATSPGTPGLEAARKRIVILRSKLTRKRKLFDAGLISEEAYFSRAQEQENPARAVAI